MVFSLGSGDILKISVKVGFFPCVALSLTYILFPKFYIAHNMSMFKSMA